MGRCLDHEGILAAIPYLTKLSDKVKKCKNLVEAIGVLTEAIGREGGAHLEKLLVKNNLG